MLTNNLSIAGAVKITVGPERVLGRGNAAYVTRTIIVEDEDGQSTTIAVSSSPGKSPNLAVVGT
jgi:hypothetical protein